MALIVVIGVMSGLQTDLREKILGANSHGMVLEIGEAVRILLKETTPLSSIGTSVQVRRRTIEAMFTDLIEAIMV